MPVHKNKAPRGTPAPPPTVSTARAPRGRPLVTSRYLPWCLRRWAPAGPGERGPGAVDRRPGGNWNANPRVGRGGVAQALQEAPRRAPRGGGQRPAGSRLGEGGGYRAEGNAKAGKGAELPAFRLPPGVAGSHRAGAGPSCCSSVGEGASPLLRGFCSFL